MAPQRKYSAQPESESEPEQLIVEQVEQQPQQYPPTSKSKRYSKKQPPPESESEEEEEEEAPAVRPRTTRPKAAARNVRRKKYANEEEARNARLEQMRRWRQNRKERTVSVVLPDVDTRNEFMKILSFIKQKVEISSALDTVLQHLISQASQN